MSRRLLARLQKHHPPEKMLLLPGSRQVGKTTPAQMALEVWPDRGVYLNWDVASHRAKILSGEDLLADWRRPSKRPMIVFDELHKMRRFKSWLKVPEPKRSEGISASGCLSTNHLASQAA